MPLSAKACQPLCVAKMAAVIMFMFSSPHSIAERLRQQLESSLRILEIASSENDSDIAENGTLNSDTSFSQHDAAKDVSITAPRLSEKSVVPIDITETNKMALMSNHVSAWPDLPARRSSLVHHHVETAQRPSLIEETREPRRPATMSGPDPTQDDKQNRFLLISGYGLAISAVLCLCCSYVQQCLLGRDSDDAEEGVRARLQYVHKGRVIYEWDQSLKSVTIYIKAPSDMKKDDLEVKITSDVLKVGRKGKAPFLRDQLYDTIDPDESSWSLRHSGELKIRLEKTRKGEWPSAFQHDKIRTESVSS